MVSVSVHNMLKDVAASFSIFLSVLSSIHNQQPVSMHARQITLDHWAAAITFIFITDNTVYASFDQK